MVSHAISNALHEARNRIADRRDGVMANIQRLAGMSHFDAIPEQVTKFNLLEAEIRTMNTAMGIASNIEDKG